MNCDPQRQQDEYFCPACQRRWSTDDEPPADCVMIVGIAGAAGAGKSTLARHLVSEHGFQRVKFAETLKDMFRVVLYDLGLSETQATEAIEGGTKEIAFPQLSGKTPRHAMQTLGTEWGRNQMGENFWVGIAEARINALLRDGVTRIVIDDVRFDNELSLIRSYPNGCVLRVTRGEESMPRKGAQHASEAGIDWNAVGYTKLRNEDTPEALFAKARAALGLPNRV
jgi:hypothetical protein